ncbi:zona pellucida sperm-binding protein 4-like [Polymixia lowei]
MPMGDSRHQLNQEWSRISGVHGVSDQWRNVNESQLLRFYESGEWDDIDDHNEGDAVIQVEDATDSFNPVADHGFEVEYMDLNPRAWTAATKESPGSTELLPVMDAPRSCNYRVNLFHNTLMVPFSGCHVRRQSEGLQYDLQLLYNNELGQTDIATVSCEASPKLDSVMKLRSSNVPDVRSSDVRSSKCTNPSVAPPTKAQNCKIPTDQQVACGFTGIPLSDCENMGCCMDSTTSACFYPLDECTADEQFVFAIHHDVASIPVDPTKLIIPGKPSCTPVIVNDKFAIFKFSVTDCGTRAYEVGETKIYLAEVQTVVQALNLKYGVITRSDPLRFLVECRYSKTNLSSDEAGNPKSLASIGYMVKNPNFTLPSKLVGDGMYGVQLRIAEDKTFSMYLPNDHQPLRLVLGKPVYLEVRLRTPKPDAVVLVNYCLAYPRSAKNALVLVYEGCANPNDPNVSILKVSDLPQNRHQRRLEIKAFQFMDQKSNKYLDEEIYFMCSTEVCRPSEKTCRQSCFDGKEL